MYYVPLIRAVTSKFFWLGLNYTGNVSLPYVNDLYSWKDGSTLDKAALRLPKDEPVINYNQTLFCMINSIIKDVYPSWTAECICQVEVGN